MCIVVQYIYINDNLSDFKIIKLLYNNCGHPDQGAGQVFS